jgi:hypothetical protein
MLIPLVVSKLCLGQEKRIDGRTDGWTKRQLDAHPSGSIKTEKTRMVFVTKNIYVSQNYVWSLM